MHCASDALIESVRPEPFGCAQDRRVEGHAPEHQGLRQAQPERCGKSKCFPGDVARTPARGVPASPGGPVAPSLRPPGGTRHQARGAAVVLALVTVFLAAGIAAAVIGNLGRSIDSATGLQDQSQARLLARGATDWARNVLADDKMNTAVDHLREPWAVRVPPTPVGEAEVSGEIQDWSGRFNLNNLAPEGKPDLTATAQFERLLLGLSVPPGRAGQLAETLLDWISADQPEGEGGGRSARRSTPADAPRGPLIDLRELIRVPGFDAELVALLGDFAVAVPAPSKINVNTAPAEVVFALTSGLDINAARVLVAERDRAWFRDLADFTARLPSGATATAPAGLDVRSRFFLVTGRARNGVSVVAMEALLDRKDTWPEILWQKIP
ncbi:MAG: type II secretion system minor pseudopilin GspK [Rhodocyclaceae bacterium]